MASKRIAEIDMAKGIGIFMIVLGHGLNALPETSYAVIFMNSFKMPLFFLLSGMVMKLPEKKETFLEAVFAERKILVTYLLSSLVYILFDTARMAIGKFTGQQLLMDVYHTGIFFGISVLWFLGSLTIAKVISRMLAVRMHKPSLNIGISLVLIVGGAAVQTLINGSSRSQDSGLYYAVISVLRSVTAAGFTLFGMMISQAFRKQVFAVEKLSVKHICITAALLLPNLALCLIAGVTDMRVGDFGHLWIVNLLLSFTGTFGTLYLCSVLKNIPPIKSILLFLGANSLLIMITHENFYIKQVIGFGVSLFFGLSAGTLAHIALQTTILLCAETVLCLIAGKAFNGLINRATAWAFLKA